MLFEFEEFFKRNGVTYSTYKLTDEYEHNKGRYVMLAVAQAIFYFDKNDVYLGVESDEMGNWYPNELNKEG